MGIGVRAGVEVEILSKRRKEEGGRSGYYA